MKHTLLVGSFTSEYDPKWINTYFFIYFSYFWIERLGELI